MSTSVAVGTVFDAETHEPVAGATVEAAEVEERGSSAKRARVRATAVNNGAPADSVIVPPRDGLFLIKRAEVVR